EVYFTGARSPKDPKHMYAVLNRLTKYDIATQTLIDAQELITPTTCWHSTMPGTSCTWLAPSTTSASTIRKPWTRSAASACRGETCPPPRRRSSSGNTPPLRVTGAAHQTRTTRFIMHTEHTSGRRILL